MDELLNTETLRAVLEEYGVAVRNLYQDRLILHDRIATGELLNSVEVHVDYDGQDYEVKLDLADYWRYVEMDTAPHWPPPSAILKWIQAKPVLPRPLKNGKLPTPQQLAFLIGRKIAVFGTKGQPDLTDSVEDMNRQYQERIAAALAHDVGSYIRKLVRTP
jgi:hypothetical protein